MEDYGQLTRAELISLIRELDAARGGAGGLASDKSAGFQVFSEWQRREFDRSPWPMRIFEHGTFRFLAVNDAAVKLYGYSREEFLKLTARDTRHLDEHAEFLTTLNEPTEYLRHRGARRHIRKDGEIIVVEAVTQDILFNGRKARLSMNIDVTERNKAEDELRRQKHLLETVIDNIPARIFIRDAKTLRYVMRNRVSEEGAGHPIGNSIGKSVYDLFPREFADLFSSTDAEALKTGRLVDIPELRVTRKSGELRILHVRKVPVFDENGQPWVLVGISNDITERKRIEDALRESNEFLRGVIESSRDCIKVLDLDGRLLMISAGGQRLLEIEDVASLLNTSWLGFWNEADHAAASAALDAARGGGVGGFEGCCTTAKGTPRWWDVVITPIFGADGAPAKLLVVTRDVTRRKQAQDMQGRLAAIVESSQDAILSRALDGTILTWNAGAERLFGYTASEIVGRNFEVLFPPEQMPEMFKRQRLLLKGEALPALETVRIAKDGRRVQISLSSAPIRDSSGKALAISTIMRDITGRILAEYELRQAQQRLQVAVRGGSVGLWDWDVATGAVYFSPEWKRQLGYEEHEVPNQFEEWECRLHPQDKAQASAAVQAFLDRPETDYQAEYRLLHRDRSYRWILSRGSAQLDANGKVERMFGCHVDITAQKEAEAERLEHAMRQRDALVREVHHRIKNSLQAVVGLLRQKIRKNPAMTPDIEETISQLQSVALVYGLQGIRSDGLLGLAEMVEAICASAEDLVGGHVDRIFERRSPRPACVAGTEAVSVAVALNELVFNALKHQPARAGRKRVQLVLCEAGDGADVRIANRGRLPKGFDYTAGRELGNGLNLVRTLLASPGGDIAFSNGRGRVEVRLKLAPPLLAGRLQWLTRRKNDGGGREAKVAAARSGRGRRPAGAGRAV